MSHLDIMVTSYFVKLWKSYFLVKSSQVHFSIEVNLTNNVLPEFFWSGFDGQEVLNKYPTFDWKELDLPTSVCHSPSWGMHLHSDVAYPPQEYTWKNEKLSNFCKSAFYTKQKSDKELGKPTLGNRKFAEREFCQFFHLTN